ncbi:MAG: T9SS type A sorting domain-containing protein [Bacteroidota bacterium]
MNYNFFLLSSFFLLLTQTPLTAQHDDGRPHSHCGVTESHPWMDAYLAGEIATPRSMMPLALPLRFIIVGTSDGTGYVNANDIMGSVCRMNDDFAESNLSFYIEGEMDTINNDSYWNHTFSTGALMMNFNNQNGVINVYVVGSPAGNCGYYSGNQDALAMDKDCMGYADPTLSHEMGHFLTLRHTFFGWEGEGDDNNPFAYLPTDEEAPVFINGRQVETVDGSNCNVAADGFCDTPPDYISERWLCNGVGMYPDSLIDPDSTLFMVNGRNIMGYANDGCVDSFSVEQITAMEINANSRSSLHTGETADDTVIPTVVQLSPENGEQVPAFNFVQLSWEPAADADFYLVELNNTQFFNGAVFRRYVVNGTTLTITQDLTANRNYYWRVRGVNKHAPCGDYGSIRRFRNGTVSSTIDPALDAAIEVFPNPVNADSRELFIQATDLPASGELNYELINTTGQVMSSRNAGLVAASGFRETIDISRLPQGMYFLRIRVGDRLLTRRVVLNR